MPWPALSIPPQWGYGGPVNSWLWSFGDTANTTSTLQNPSFIYVDSGTYTITLIAATAYCQDSVSQTIVVEAKPNAGFTPSDTVACSPFTVAFTNTSVGAVSYAWSFGDGNTSAAVSPSHTFIHSALTDTTFVVRMIAQSAFWGVSIRCMTPSLFWEIQLLLSPLMPCWIVPPSRLIFQIAQPALFPGFGILEILQEVRCKTRLRSLKTKPSSSRIIR